VSELFQLQGMTKKEARSRKSVRMMMMLLISMMEHPMFEEFGENRRLIKTYDHLDEALTLLKEEDDRIWLSDVL